MFSNMAYPEDSLNRVHALPEQIHAELLKAGTSDGGVKSLCPRTRSRSQCWLEWHWTTIALPSQKLSTTDGLPLGLLLMSFLCFRLNSCKATSTCESGEAQSLDEMSDV